jgi:MOSC domain-containing protein YiiM
MKLLSIQIGRAEQHLFKGKAFTTALFKKPVDGEIEVRKLGLEGDRQVDRRFHGGEEKAVYAFSADIYPWWESEVGRSLPWGSFGENLTFSDLDESRCYIGNIYRLGTCRLQVSEPRFPCATLGKCFNDMTIVKTFQRRARPGVYFRVLEEGCIRAGEELDLLEPDPEKVSILDVFQWHGKTLPREAIERMLRIKSLNADWRELMKSKLAICDKA